MQKDYKNKMMTGEQSKNKKQEDPSLEDYHFPGSGEYEPMTIQATSREEAEKEWAKTRKKVEVKKTEQSNLNEQSL